MMVQFRHWTPTSAFAGSAAPVLRIVQSGSPELDDVREDDGSVMQEAPMPNPTPAATSVDPSLDAELIAMRAVGEALANLDDAETRARVVRWALDRFCPDARSTATPEPVAAQQPIPMYTQPVAPIAPIAVFSCPMAANSSQAVISALAAASSGPGAATSHSHASPGSEPPAGSGHTHRRGDDDQQLSVSDLETFFDKAQPVEDEPRPLEDELIAVDPEHAEEPAAPAAAMDMTAPPSRPTVSGPIHIMLQDLITQFRDLANEWEFAGADP
jgi:hypothetical protein